MSVDKWKASADIVAVMKELVVLYHPDLVPLMDEIAVIFREKAQSVGGTMIYGTAKKAPAILDVLGDGNYKFVIELASDLWQGLNSDQKKALLDHCLLRCTAEFDQTKGEYKTATRGPDIVAFREELERWGMWWPNEEPSDKAGNEVLDDNIELGYALADNMRKNTSTIAEDFLDTADL